MNGRPPQTLTEQILANTRPQPAIPAVLALMLMVLLPAMSAGAGVSAWHVWLLPVGVLVSAGLAVAAGFCSLAPQLIWLLLSLWGLTLVGRTELPVWHETIFYLAAIAVSAMFFIQLWRIITRRFVPTINEAKE